MLYYVTYNITFNHGFTLLSLIKTVLTSVRKFLVFCCKRNKPQSSSVPLLQSKSALMSVSLALYPSMIDHTFIPCHRLSFGSQGNLRLGDLLCLIRALWGELWLQSGTHSPANSQSAPLLSFTSSETHSLSLLSCLSENLHSYLLSSVSTHPTSRNHPHSSAVTSHHLLFINTCPSPASSLPWVPDSGMPNIWWVALLECVSQFLKQYTRNKLSTSLPKPARSLGLPVLNAGIFVHLGNLSLQKLI